MNFKVWAVNPAGFKLRFCYKRQEYIPSFEYLASINNDCEFPDCHEYTARQEKAIHITLIKYSAETKYLASLNLDI